MNDHAGSSPDPQLRTALLQYAKTPGKYQLTLRQPAILFRSIREILQLAAGRGGEQAAAARELRDAAAFFLHAALLYPGADHYAVLGLPARGELVELKERYRLLMRLIHPDYASSGALPWPADAAVRVNRAYEVLSSPVLRREYDEQLAGRRAPAETSAPRPHRGAATGPRDAAPNAWTASRKSAAAVLAGTTALLALALLMPASAPDQLVQKAPTRVVAAAPPAADAVPAEVPQPALAPSASLSATQPSPAPLPVPEAPADPAPSASPDPAAADPAPARAPAPAASPVTARPGSPPTRRGDMPAPPPRVHAPAPAPSPATTTVLVPPTSSPQASVPATGPALAMSIPNAAAPGPAPAPAPVPAPPAARITAAAAYPASPTLAEAQPLLTQLLQLLESGSGEQLLRLLDADARGNPAAQALSRHYEQLVRGGRPVRLTHVDFRGEPREGVLLVTGRIRLHAGEPTIDSHGERIVVRAEFASRGGRVMLTGLGGGAE